MHTIPSELPPPKNETDFEHMCAYVYGVVFGDPTPKINGRKGQKQGGVDVFIMAKGIGRIGIQCKKYDHIKIKWEHVEEEVAKADEFGTPIKRLLIATTSPNDADLLKKVQILSDARDKDGKFTVDIEFWDDIQLRVNAHQILQDSYMPHSSGAAYHRQSEELKQVKKIVVETNDHIAAMAALPQGREDSANKLITRQLDRTNKLLAAGRYRDALEHVDGIGGDLAPFDNHQKARWYLQRGLCLLFSRNDEKEASELFIKASNLYPDDERMVAVGIRGLMTSGNIESAMASGRDATERFPMSVQVWLTYAHARMKSGERIELANIPSKFQNEPASFHLAAISARQHGNVSAAAELAQRAAEHASAGFFHRATFLELAVEDAAAEPVLAQFGLMDTEKKARLEKAVAHFDDRMVRLWSIQSDACMETATHLGFAFLLLDRPAMALAVSQDAKNRGFHSPELLRVEIQALDESGKKKEALAMARTSMSALLFPALFVASEIAANQGDVPFLEEAARVASEKFPENIELEDLIRVLRWTALERSGQVATAMKEILSPVQGVPDRLIPLKMAATLLKQERRNIEAAEMVDSAVALIDSGSKTSDKLLVAELLSRFERWAEAALIYEGILAGAGKGPSELHARLLECYVESENRSKAKALLSGMPSGWIDHDKTRRCAINLGVKTKDWHFLLPLAEKQLHKAPTKAVSWLFKLDALRHINPATFQNEMGMVPDDVSGSIQHIGSLAELELRYEQGEKGLRRLYRLARRNMDEPEAYSIYLINFFTGKIPPLDNSPTHVAPGCAITLIDNANSSQETIVIDPLEAGQMPKRDGFFPPDDPDVSVFMGKDVGSEVVVPLQAGGSRLFKIAAIGCAYHHMASVAREREHKFNGIPHIKSIHIETTGNPEKDLAPLQETIRRVSDGSAQVLKLYASGALTLSMVATILERSPIDICLGWPSDAPPLFVGRGLARERDAALESANLIVVADSAALCELAKHEVEHALSVLPKLWITSATRDVVDAFVEKAENDPSCGVAFNNGGKLGVVVLDDAWKNQRIAFARRLDKIVANCEVLPAYGDAGSPEQASILDRLGSEEKEVLLLAKEHGASILTLDGRIRQWAQTFFDIAGLSPQTLVIHAHNNGILSQNEMSAFTIGEFLTNRSFVSLCSENLLWMVAQGDDWLQTGMSLFKHYLASPGIDRDSVFRVALEFLVGVAQFETQVGAFAELLSHVAEAMFRRADCPPDWREQLIKFVADILLDAAPKGHILDKVYGIINHEIIMNMKELTSSINIAYKRSQEVLSSRPLKIRVLHCATRPCLVVDRSAAS